MRVCFGHGTHQLGITRACRAHRPEPRRETQRLRPPDARRARRAYTRYEDDASLRCAVLFAHGDHFTGGLDLARSAPPSRAVVRSSPTAAWTRSASALAAARSPSCARSRATASRSVSSSPLATDVRFASGRREARAARGEARHLPLRRRHASPPAVAGWGNAMKWLSRATRSMRPRRSRIGVVQEVLPRAEVLARAVASCRPRRASGAARGAGLLASARNAADHGPTPDRKAPRARPRLDDDRGRHRGVCAPSSSAAKESSPVDEPAVLLFRLHIALRVPRLDPAQALASKHDRELRPVPVLFAAMLDASGARGPAEIPLKREYMFRDVNRLAKMLGSRSSRPRRIPSTARRAPRDARYERLAIRRGALPGHVGRIASRRPARGRRRDRWRTGLDGTAILEESRARRSRRACGPPPRRRSREAPSECRR